MLYGLHSYFLSKITYLLYTQVSDSSTCHFIFCNFSRDMLSINLVKILVCLLISVSLLTGQFPDRSISAYSLSLSCRNKTCTVLHQVGVLFDLYYDARKHKSKIKRENCVYSSGIYKIGSFVS